MKAIIIAVVAMIVMMVALQFKSSSETVTYIKESVTPEVVLEDWQTDEEAIQAAKDVVRKKELQAELQGLKDLQASTTTKIKEVEKELNSY